MKKYTDERVFMNTNIGIHVFSDKGTVFTRELIEQAYSVFDLVVKKYTRFDTSSELSRLNKSNGSPTTVSEELFHLVEYMLSLSEITHGVFDPTIIDLLEMYGYDAERSYEKLNDNKLMGRIKDYVSKRHKPSEIVLNKKNSTITLASSQRLDLGSIGKGFAVDLAYKVLNEHFPAFMINAGGDIRFKPDQNIKPSWKLDLYKTALPNRINQDYSWGTLELDKPMSLAGSGGWVRRIKFFHHLLNPNTGLPENKVSQTFTIADTSIKADAWATILFLMGESGTKLAKAHKIGYMIVQANGEITSSEEFTL